MRLTGEAPLQLVRIREDSFGYADMRNGFLRLIVIEGDFEADFFRIADSFLAKGGAFLDVGANHGLLSFGLAGKFGQTIDFHLFEPNQELLKSIELTRKLYPDMRLSIVEAAVSDRKSVVSFEIDHAQSGMSHISDGGDITVAATSLDAYIAENGLDCADLVKIDIEGFELHALKGAKTALENRKIRAIYFEYCEKWLVRAGHPREVFEFLDSVGFQACLCRTDDLADHGGATHTITPGLAGHGALLKPVRGFAPPVSTDLLAVPNEHLSSLQV